MVVNQQLYCFHLQGCATLAEGHHHKGMLPSPIPAQTGVHLINYACLLNTDRGAVGAGQHLIYPHQRGNMGGAQQGQQAVLGDKVKGVGLLQAQQDGQRQIEAPLQLVQVRSRLQQRPAVPAGAPRPAHQYLTVMIVTSHRLGLS